MLGDYLFWVMIVLAYMSAGLGFVAGISWEKSQRIKKNCENIARKFDSKELKE